MLLAVHLFLLSTRDLAIRVSFRLPRVENAFHFLQSLYNSSNMPKVGGKTLFDDGLLTPRRTLRSWRAYSALNRLNGHLNDRGSSSSRRFLHERRVARLYKKVRLALGKKY